MGYLATDMVGAIDGEAAGREGEGGVVRAFDRGHPTITIACPTSMVTQTDGILYSLLHTDMDEIILSSFK